MGGTWGPSSGAGGGLVTCLRFQSISLTPGRLHLCARVGEVLEGFPARVLLGWDWRQVVVGESETKVI